MQVQQVGKVEEHGQGKNKRVSRSGLTRFRSSQRAEQEEIYIQIYEKVNIPNNDLVVNMPAKGLGFKRSFF